MTVHKTKILVVGSGFAGIKTALELADNPAFEVALIAEESDFRYYPALYHTATGGRATASSIPLTEIFKNKNVEIIKGRAVTIDRQKKTLGLAGKKSVGYDRLVIALGVITNYFGIKGLDKYSYGIKSQAEASQLRDHIHKQLLDE
ncbi:MAG TPA: FAD-dependent oxidoreductase, partial [Candidatus Saccharimonadales bacterium]|nr:FAD-dependent oxidoreductase [Candidatus Saccharimonadales bacterium]